MIPNCASCSRCTMIECGFTGTDVASQCSLFEVSKHAIRRENEAAREAKRKKWFPENIPPAMKDQRLAELARGPVLNGLICPQCGDPDRRNTMNGRPWCMKCNVELMPKTKVEKWNKKVMKIRLVNRQ